MNADPRGTCYAGDDDFDNLHARVVARHDVVGITRDGYVVRHIVTVCDFGKPSRTPADPDAALADEGTDLDDNPRPRHTHRGPRVATTALLARIHAALVDCPLNARELAAMLGVTVPRVRAALRNHAAGVEVVGRDVYGSVYALADEGVGD